MNPTRQRVNLSQAPSLIRHRLDFTAGANTLRGYTNYEGDYIIKSYAEVIGRWNKDGSVWITDQKFSQTTSRHTSVVRRGLAEPLAQASNNNVFEAIARLAEAIDPNHDLAGAN